MANVPITIHGKVEQHPDGTVTITGTASIAGLQVGGGPAEPTAPAGAPGHPTAPSPPPAPGAPSHQPVPGPGPHKT